MLVLASSSFWVLGKSETFRKLPPLERLILGAGTSVSVFVIFNSWYGTLAKSGFSSFTNILFYLGLAFTIFWFISLFKRRKSFKLPKFSFLEKTTLILIFVIFAKVLYLYTINPVIDPDVVVSYLPFARSIILLDRVPAKDIFTLNPMTVPPIGGPILFASYYSLAGSVFSEGFRFLTLPFFIGMAVITYAIARKIFSRRRLYALISVLVFLSLPIIDAMLLEWKLYPDIVFSFLALTAFYFLSFRFFYVTKKVKFLLSFLIGLILAASLLLKGQGLFLVYLIFIYSILGAVGKKSRLFVFPLILLALPFLTTVVKIPGLTNFGFKKPEILTVIFYGMPMMLLGYLVVQSMGGYKLRKISYLPLAYIISALGLLWFVRNIVLYENYLSPLNEDFIELARLRTLLGVVVQKNGRVLPLLSLFALSSSGSLYFLPKVIGIVKSFFDKRFYFVLLWVFSWYAISILLLGHASSRYTFLVFPVLSIIIVYGIQKASEIFIKKEIIKEKFVFIVAALSAVISLSQSIFLSWNFGAIIFPQEILRKIMVGDEFAVGEVVTIIPRKITSSILSFVRLLNLRADLYGESEIWSLLLIGFVISLIVLIISFFIIRLITRTNLKALVIIFSLLLITPYIYTTSKISNGNLKSFTRSEEEKIYNYSGASTHIVPYLKENANSTSIVLVVGPRTGLSYKTGLGSRNLEVGPGLLEIAPIIFERDNEKILSFFKEHNIFYVAIFRGDNSKKTVDALKEKTAILDMTEDPEYFIKVVGADQQNLWELYEIKLNQI